MKKIAIVLTLFSVAFLIFLIYFFKNHIYSTPIVQTKSTEKENTSMYTSQVLETFYFDNTPNESEEGVLKITNADFIKKAKNITINTSYNELLTVFEKEPKQVLETGVDRYIYFNDEYALIITQGLDVVLVEKNNQSNRTIIDSCDNYS